MFHATVLVLTPAEHHRNFDAVVAAVMRAARKAWLMRKASIDRMRR
jgi:hypothetical protein